MPRTIRSCPRSSSRRCARRGSTSARARRIVRVARRGRSGVRVTLEQRRRDIADADRRDAPSPRHRAAGRSRRARAREGRHPLRREGDQGEHAAAGPGTPASTRSATPSADAQFTHWAELSGGPRRALHPLPLRRQGAPGHPSLGDLHRAGARACRPERGGGAASLQAAAGAALAVRGERPRPYRTARRAAS